PVAQMPLVDVVRGAATSEEVVHAVAKLALQLGKTPVITADKAGFVVNRLLGPYLDEAVRLFETGIDAPRIDAVAREFGLPMGPLELLDEVGFDIAAHAAESLESAFGARMRPSGLLKRMLDSGMKGKKSGAGFYLHAAGQRGKERVPNPDLGRLLPGPRAGAGGLTEPVMIDYLLMAMLAEAILVLEERVVAGPRELDLATVFGRGFPPFRGGLLRWADQLGAKETLARLQRVYAAADVQARGEGAARFRPPPLLRTLVETNGRFHDAARG
ncbi:MAG TPA: 3-hydroxyacyl-CoA dehydrogenase family protein, partial [Planctomycetota bacterium]|nr:3-hydroxyacyl-CoA dehydrogenase family protein [Planctomycetota bacterium]